MQKANITSFVCLFIYLTILIVAGSCDTDTEICEKGESAKLYYQPYCASINGYIILEGSNKTFVFQHDIDEKFQKSEVDVCVEYQLVEENIPLTAECVQAPIIIITSLRER